MNSRSLSAQVASRTVHAGVAPSSDVRAESANKWLDPALLRNRVFVSANASFIMAMLALFAVGFLLPFYFEDLRGYDTRLSGLLLTPLSLTLGVVAPFSGTLADRVGSRGDRAGPGK